MVGWLLEIIWSTLAEFPLVLWIQTHSSLPRCVRNSWKGLSIKYLFKRVKQLLPTNACSVIFSGFYLSHHFVWNIAGLCESKPNLCEGPNWNSLIVLEGSDFLGQTICGLDVDSIMLSTAAWLSTAVPAWDRHSTGCCGAVPRICPSGRPRRQSLNLT